MHYPNPFPMDDQMRVKVCPYCGNTRFSAKSNVCIPCGHSRRNLCLGKNGTRHPNPGNARYCEICGDETVFFRDGLLPARDNPAAGEEPENRDRPL